MRPGCLLALLALLVSAPLRAQDDGFDPDAFDPAAFDEPVSPWSLHGSARLRGEDVSGLPAQREDLERVRGELVLGLEGAWSNGFGLGLGLRAAAGSDSNRDNLANNDNQPSNGVDPDHWWLGYRTPGLGAVLGKQPLPLELSPMLWDADQRPLGAFLAVRRDVRGFDRLVLDAGAARLDHALGGESRFTAVQASWLIRPGAELSGDLRLAWIGHSRVDSLARDGLARGNRGDGSGLLSDFRLLDLQIGLRREFPNGPLRARLDLVRNLGADDRRDGARASLVFGDRFVPGQWEFGWSWERIQADAVLAAANSDDWWFHAGMRGHMPWVGYGFDSGLSVRLAAFLEHRDGIPGRTDRILLDLEARW